LSEGKFAGKSTQTGWRMMINDIDKYKQTKEALKCCEEKYRSLIEQSLDMFFLYDLKGNLSYVNKAAIEKTGYYEEELLSLNIFDLFPEQFDHDRTLHEWKNWTIGHKIKLESQITSKNGIVYFVEINLSKLTVGQREYILALVRDITEQKQSVFLPIAFDISERKRAEVATKEANQRLLTVLDSINAMIYVADMESHEILFINQYVRDKFGDIVGKKCRNGFQSEQIDFFCDFCKIPNWIEVSGNPKGISRREFQDKKTGRWYDSQARAIKWIDDRMVRLEVCIDITDRKQAEVQLRESEIRNRTMLKSIPDLMFINSREGIFLDYHAYDQRLLLAEPEQFLGKSIKEVLPANVANQVLHCFGAVHETKQVQV
jgi:PAS domain S-box-containing protein